MVIRWKNVCLTNKMVHDLSSFFDAHGQKCQLSYT